MANRNRHGFSIVQCLPGSQQPQILRPWKRRATKMSGSEELKPDVKTKTVNKAPELDVSRKTGADPRDPRYSRSWPCFAEHSPAKPQSNQWCQYTECKVCQLRLQYIPRVGCTGEYANQYQPATVTRALKELALEMKNTLPIGAQVRAMIKKVNAEIRLEGLSSTSKSKKVALRSVSTTSNPADRPSKKEPSATKVKLEPGEMAIPQSPRSSTASWSQVAQEAAENEMVETISHLTPEELDHLRQLAVLRKTTAPGPMTTDSSPPAA
jgi:hypothetical protein